jgi:hypothetical protein
MAQPVRTQTGQTYGVAKAQADAQRAMPLAQVPTASPPGGAPAALGTEPSAQGGDHPAVGSLYGDTMRPDEPVTAGLASGAGPGPTFGALNDRDVLAALARKFPGLPGLDRMIAEMH